MRTVYLDHASATPIDAHAFGVLTKTFKTAYGNPSAYHALGILAKNILTTARTKIAFLIEALSDEIIFTSGATESDNLALLGTVTAWQETHPGRIPHVVVSAIEHAAILEAARVLEKEGTIVSIIPVSKDGLVDPHDVLKALTPDTVIVSIMYANNEIGTIQPIHEIAKSIRHFKKINLQKRYPLFHTDAAQATNYLSMRTPALGVDLMSLSSSKIYGPKGIGALFIKRNTPIHALVVGGSQEFNMRAGTESVALASSFATAFETAIKIKDRESKRLTTLRDLLLNLLKKSFPDLCVYGSMTERLPNNLNVSIPGFESETLIIYLDAHGVAVSGKSACKSDFPGTSHVIEALGLENTQSTVGSIRFSLGRSTTVTDIRYTVKTLSEITKVLSYRQ